MPKLGKLRCSFCKKTDAEVSKLAAGPGVHICDECVTIASRLMAAPPIAPISAAQPWQRRIMTGIRRLLHVDEQGLGSIPTS